jgi:hypothetical protein
MEGTKCIAPTKELAPGMATISRTKKKDEREEDQGQDHLNVIVVVVVVGFFFLSFSSGFSGIFQATRYVCLDPGHGEMKRY